MIHRTITESYKACKWHSNGVLLMPRMTKCQREHLGSNARPVAFPNRNQIIMLGAYMESFTVA